MVRRESGTSFWKRAYQRRPVRPGDPAVTLGAVTWRMRNVGDIVTYVPIWPFYHCGQAVDFPAPQPGAPSPFLPSASVPMAGGGWTGWESAYRLARTNLPYNPLALLIDALLLVVDSAPKHFMKLYGEAFEVTPVLTHLLPSKPKHARTILDRCLRPIKWAIALLLVAALLAATGLMIWLSPQLALIWVTFLGMNLLAQYLSR